MILWSVAAAYAVLSMITTAAFAIDKRAAKLGRRRISERTLHVLELLGGWPGAMIAITILRHKSSKPTFYLLTLCAAAVHTVGWWAAYRYL